MFLLLWWFFQIVFGYYLGDLIAGIYHWLKDTYFSPLTPVIGQTFIWPSRLHHIKPRYLTATPDKELFMSSMKWSLIWMIPLIYYTGISLISLSLFFTIAINDIIHKYNHMMDDERPKMIRFLQKIYLIQTDEEHRLHHLEPHTTHYCPITPFVNPVLERINFFRYLEYLIEKYIGVKPRIEECRFMEDSECPGNIRFIR